MEIHFISNFYVIMTIFHLIIKFSKLTHFVLKIPKISDFRLMTLEKKFTKSKIYDVRLKDLAKTCQIDSY